MQMRLFALALGTISLMVYAADSATASDIARAKEQGIYRWSRMPIAREAELLTLFCRACDAAAGSDRDVPLVSILRDDLGDNDPETDRITEIWLLSYTRPSIGKRLLSAIPFFYWRVGNSGAQHGSLPPLLNMNSLQRPMANAMLQNLVQWTVLDTTSMPVRASSRAYRKNAADDERLHLEEALGYLRQAPADGPEAPFSSAQLHTLMARLELRKAFLGGFVTERGAAEYGESAAIRYQQIRARNWELLRQWADKTGLFFEPLAIAGTSGEYAAVWVPRTGARPNTGTSVAPIWKLLNLKPPSYKELQEISTNRVYKRTLDENGVLLPEGVSSNRHIDLIPLGIYSLDYPKMPLLMVDFRNGHHVRWRAMLQRSINELTAGVIGISHFTNWYYYAAADLYDFVASRHGSPMNAAERLDCYSQFRSRLVLDRELDPQLRAQARGQASTLAFNPLESSPEHEMAAAMRNFDRLQEEVENGRLLNVIDKDRRRELASYDSNKFHGLRQEIFRIATFGAHLPEANRSETIAAQVSLIRRAQYHLQFLEQVTEENTPPEVGFDKPRLARSLAALDELLPRIASTRFRRQAQEVLIRLKNISEDENLRAQCSQTLVSLGKSAAATHQLALKPTVVRTPAAASAFQ